MNEHVAASPDVPADPQPTVAATGPSVPLPGAWGALAVLTVLYTFGFIDRQIINILAEPIRRDLGLRDWHLGILTGFSFALFYSTFSLPVASLADRTNRSRLIAVALGVWSIFTALGGAAHTFFQLALTRFGVGMGEAGCTPPSHALIADYFPANRRAGALGIYATGISIGSLIGLGVGGVVLDHFGWRWAFVIVGLPGVLFALFVPRLLKDPRERHAGAAAPKHGAGAVGLGGAFRTLWAMPAFRYTALGTSLTSVTAYSVPAFTPTFFFRAHGGDLAQAGAAAGHGAMASASFLGLALGLIAGVAGAAGTVLGGMLTDRVARRNIRGYMYVPAAAMVLSVPFYWLAFSAKGVTAALAFLATATFIKTSGFPASYGSVQVLVDTRMRATASAMLLFGINLIGLGVGPLAVGLMSDFAMGFGLNSADSLRIGIMGSCGVGLIGAALLLRASKFYR